MKDVRLESRERGMEHTGCGARGDRGERVDPVTVAATSRTDRSRVIFLRVSTPASALMDFARCLLVSSGWESTRFILIERYVSEATRLGKGKTHVFRA